uniref:Uncharacterized protein n=1 Tax=Zea mays TaxID=4577 RepID=A0A804M7P3_MAIZE
MCLTSASLVRAFHGKTNEQYYELKIKVRCEGNEVYKGFLAEYDLDHNFVVVNIDAFLGVHVGSSQCVLESVLRGAAYVVGRGVSGDLISRSVELGCDLSVSKHGQDLESKTSEAWEGGIVFSLNGESVGMNLFLVMGRTIFLPWGTIFEHLRHFGKSWQRSQMRLPRNATPALLILALSIAGETALNPRPGDSVKQLLPQHQPGKDCSDG